MVGRFMKQAAERDYSKFWQGEGTFPKMFQSKKPPLQRPGSIVENYVKCVTGEKPMWMPIYMDETNTVWPDAIEEHPVPEVDGYDWWGVDWVMEEKIGGMITRPGTRTFSEFANWKEELEWPDLSVVDFAADGKKLSANFDPDRVHTYECVEGLFERLHEMIPFDETLVAFYEEPELLAEFFHKMADYKIECCTKVFENYGRVDGVLYHDDWGMEKSGFFSNEMFREQIMPETKRLFDFIHSQGKFIELHSCGRNTQYVPEMIEMGINCWTPQWRCNDKDFLYDTYGDKMSFTIQLDIPKGASEEEIRSLARKFVDRYGTTGRTLVWIMSGDPKADAIAKQEIVDYSFNVYARR